MKYSLFLSILIAASCTAGDEKTSGQDRVTGIEKKSGNIEGCYRQVLARDTIFASIRQHGTEISGSLRFDNYEKDASSGTIQGVLEGDNARLFYSFQSEGINSVMEVCFRVTDAGILRGVGKMEMRNDTLFFTGDSRIGYPGEGLMQRVDCGD